MCLTVNECQKSETDNCVHMDPHRFILGVICNLGVICKKDASIAQYLCVWENPVNWFANEVLSSGYMLALLNRLINIFIP